MSTTFWIQFLGIIFGIAMLYFSFVKYKRKEINSTELGFWMLCWVLIIIVAIVPYALDFVIGPLNFYRRLDFFVVIGFFVLLAISFYNYSMMKKMNKKVEEVVRHQALEKKP